MKTKFKIFEEYKKYVNKSFKIDMKYVDDVIEFISSEYGTLDKNFLTKYLNEYKTDLLNILQTDFSFNNDGELIGIENFPQTIELYRIIDNDVIDTKCLGISWTYSKDWILNKDFQSSVGFDKSKKWFVVAATFKKSDINVEDFGEVLVRLSHERELRVKSKCTKPTKYDIIPYDIFKSNKLIESKTFKNFKLNENPDNVEFDVGLDFLNIDALPFAIDESGNLYFEKFKEVHPNWIETVDFMDYPGRLWFRSKVISFWEYPEDKKTLDNIINQINDNIENIRHAETSDGWRTIGSTEPFDIEPIDDTWRIEIITNSDLESSFNYGVKYNEDEVVIDTSLIPIGEYKTSLNPSEEEQALHLMNATDKAKKLKEMGYKSKVSKWKKWQKPFENKENMIQKFNIYNNKNNK